MDQTSSRRITFFVGLVAALAGMALVAVFRFSGPAPAFLTIAAFVGTAIVLEQAKAKHRYGSSSSTAYLLYISSIVLFGGFWACVVAGSALLIQQVWSRKPAIKIVFNVSSEVLAVGAASLVFVGLGGHTPATFLPGSPQALAGTARWDFMLFFVLSAVYFTINSVAVAHIIALNSDRTFREVWNSNKRGVVSFDIGACALALLVAFAFSFCESRLGLGELGLVAAAIPIVVVRSLYRLYWEQQKSGEELLQLMVKAIEARDPYTSGHSLRVQQLSRAIAMELGVNTAAIEEVETAALLHDVGKIHEEFAPLLRKETRLNEQETLVMQTHSTRSADLVGIITKLRGSVQESVRHHHERWDGKGYPSGLAGETIPLASRIILVADTIDAMTTDRPYRKRLPLEDVVAELQKHRGAQFDPRIVEVAVSSLAVRRLIVDPNWASREREERNAPPSSVAQGEWFARPRRRSRLGSAEGADTSKS